MYTNINLLLNQNALNKLNKIQHNLKSIMYAFFHILITKS